MNWWFRFLMSRRVYYWILLKYWKVAWTISYFLQFWASPSLWATWYFGLVIFDDLEIFVLNMFKLVLKAFFTSFFRKVRSDMAMAKREQAAQAEERQPYIFLRKMRSDPSSRVSLILQLSVAMMGWVWVDYIVYKQIQRFLSYLQQLTKILLKISIFHNVLTFMFCTLTKNWVVNNIKSTWNQLIILTDNCSKRMSEYSQTWW